jgi:5-carboxymethyl-2-hydroxymuconic-semialdehyde dehydrogenase
MPYAYPGNVELGNLIAEAANGIGVKSRAHRVAAAVEAGMCFVNSQNVRDLRQPFGGTKASGVGREGGTWSYEVFLEPKNVCVSLGSHHIPRWGV